jgi:hypothetical protein
VSKEFLEARVLEIQKALTESTTQYKSAQAVLEQATAHYNSLMGRLNEAQFHLAELHKTELTSKPSEVN